MMSTFQSGPIPETPWPAFSRSAKDLEEIWVPKHQFEDAILDLTRDLLPGAALVFGGICLGQGFILFLEQPNAVSLALAVSVVVGAILWLGAAVYSRVSMWLSWVNPMAFLTLAGTQAVSLVNAAETGNAVFSIPVLLSLVGGASLFLSRPWALASAAVGLLGWVALVWNLIALPAQMPWVFALLGAFALALWMFWTRYRSVRGLIYFQLQEEKRKELLMVRVDDAFKSSAELFELTVRDPLTGAYNRRYLAQLRKELEGDHKEWGVLLLDLDDFKGVNDRYGHEAGDRALQKMAHFIRRLGRSEDKLIRYGGDEFLLLVNVRSEEEVHQVATRLRERAAAESPLAFSMGAVHRRKGETLSDLLQRADEAMYRDKKRTYHYSNLKPDGPRRAQAL